MALGHLTATRSGELDPGVAVRYAGRVVVTKSAALRRAEVLRAEAEDLLRQAEVAQDDMIAAWGLFTEAAARERDAHMWEARAGTAERQGPDQTVNPLDSNPKTKGYHKGEGQKGRF